MTRREAARAPIMIVMILGRNSLGWGALTRVVCLRDAQHFAARIACLYLFDRGSN